MKPLLPVFLVASFFAAGSQNVEPPSNPSLTTEELKELIATAKSPEDHRKIAAYYEDEAKKLDAMKAGHTEMGAEYDKNPQRYPSKLALGQHCRNLASYYGLAKQKALELAAMHKEMAKQLEPPTN
jgi:hypothetical protein